ncbi:MAG: hypothetical protein GY870_00945, partial [archaeon]|nr:hypothetical protein [archaeon]
RSGMNNAGMDYKNFEFSHLSNPFGFLYFLIFNPMNGEPFLPWIIIPFAVAGVGENLSKMVKDGSKDKYIEFNRKVFKEGLILISVGIILGFRYTTDDLGWGLIDGFNNSINILFTDIVGISSQGNLSVPEFLIHSTTANMFYNLGVGYLLLALCFYICEIKGHKGKIVKFLSFYGKVSLSIYILHILLGGIFLGKLIFDVFIYVAFIIFALYYIMKVWAYKFDMKFTPEFFIIAFGTAYVNKKKAIREKISKKIEKPST